MKVIYAILTAVGWLWLVVVMVYLWIRFRREARERRQGGFEVIVSESEAQADVQDAVAGRKE